MQDRAEKAKLISDHDASQEKINHLHKNGELADKLIDYGLPMYGLGMFSGTECMIASSAILGEIGLSALLSGTVVILTGTALNLAIIGGGLYGIRYHLSTREKQLIVQRMLDEINDSKDLDALLTKAENIRQHYSPYLRAERGFYSYSLVQQWVGNKYGHETGNTRSWQAVTAALEEKCRELAGKDINNAMQKLRGILAAPVTAVTQDTKTAGAQTGEAAKQPTRRA